MRTAYLAGKMRGVPHFNFPLFDEVQKILEGRGWRIISPAALDREAMPINGVDIERLPADYNFSAQNIRDFVRRDIDAILTLRKESGDALILLPGWETSTGAKAEYAVAIWLGLDIFEFFRYNRGPGERVDTLMKINTNYPVAGVKQ